MAMMNPILRLRRAFRSVGMEAEQANEAADAVEQHSYSRSESDQRLALIIAELHREMAELRHQILVGTMVIVGVAVAILSAIIAVVAVLT